MNRKRRTTSRPELLQRNVEVTSVSARMATRVDHPRGQEPYIECGPWLELRGTLDEPVKGVSDVLISMYPEDEVRVGTRRPASVGAIIGLKPKMSVVLTWPHREFDRLWALALSGRLGFAYLCFTPTHYGKAGVVNASFSTEAEE